MTASEIRDALTDRQAVAATVFGEARQEPLRGQHAVGWVIRNRTAYPTRFGRGYAGVCLRPWQFSCWHPQGGTTNYAAVMAVARQLVDGITPRPGSALAKALQVADDVMQGLAPDPTNGADHYYSESAMVPPGRVPVWARGLTPTAVIGGHRFFRLVR